ncbi:hypothetical protein DXG01_004434 [Tephrocybe rancida]|nr:hypothetical protein DXG01_004434 [Tephrocybe rancida]
MSDETVLFEHTETRRLLQLVKIDDWRFDLKLTPLPPSSPPQKWRLHRLPGPGNFVQIENLDFKVYIVLGVPRVGTVTSPAGHWEIGPTPPNEPFTIGDGPFKLCVTGEGLDTLVETVANGTDTWRKIIERPNDRIYS